MAENMRANMQNPNFLKEKEERLQKVAHEVIKKRKEREKMFDHPFEDPPNKENLVCQDNR